MDIVGIAIRNARLTHLADAVPDARGRARLPLDPEGGRARRPDPDHLCQHDLFRHLARGLRAAAAAADGDAAEDHRQRQGDDRRRAYQGGGNVVVEFQAGSDLDKALEDVRNKVADAKPDLPDGRRRADRQRGQPVRVPGAGRDAVGRRAGARPDRRRRASCATASRRCRAFSTPRSRACATTWSR